MKYKRIINRFKIKLKLRFNKEYRDHISEKMQGEGIVLFKKIGEKGTKFISMKVRADYDYSWTIGWDVEEKGCLAQYIPYSL